MVVAMISASCPPMRQLSLDLIKAPEPSRNSRIGSANAPERGSDVPMARTMTRFGCVPLMIKPPISTLSPVSTRKRVAMLPREPGGAVGVGVAVGGVGVAVGGGGLAVGVALGEGGVAVAVGVGVGAPITKVDSPLLLVNVAAPGVTE